MDWNQTVTTIISILVPMLGGFIWMFKLHLEVLREIRQMGERVSRMEGYLEGYFGNSRRAGGEK